MEYNILISKYLLDYNGFGTIEYGKNCVGQCLFD